MKRAITILLALLLVLSFAACAKLDYPTYELTPNEYLMVEDGSDTGDGGVDAPQTPDGSAAQLTVDDIQSMNGGNAQLVFSDEGYLTFLQGKYYEGQITNEEDAVASLQGIAGLLGLGAGSEFFAKYGETDDDGYTYYVFQQRYGDSTVLYGTLRVIVGPDGYTAVMSSSFTPNLGIAETADPITAEEAETVLRTMFEERGITGLTYYSEYTSKVTVTYQNVNYNCYAIYTNNPDATKSFDMPYYEHFVTYDGQVVYNLPVATLTTDNFDVDKASEYFNGLEPATFSGEVQLYDGGTRHIEIPIAYNPADGLYYLADVERKIMVADYAAFQYGGHTLDFITSTDGRSWKNIHLITYSNYLSAYDFYNERGIRSIDGFGVPVLVCVDFCDQNGVSLDNCCHFGINNGWGCFAASDGYNNSEGLDIIVHEFTHGVTQYSMSGINYVNETGAINEAYSDIMGNIVEMLTGYTTDTQWRIGEMTGTVWRSMSSPNDYNQPTSRSDPYYLPPVDNPGSENDNGGVHINSSLLNSVAYKLWEAGMPLEDEASLWVTSIELITPLSGYNEIHAALLMSVDINGFDAGYKQLITDAFNAAELLN